MEKSEVYVKVENKKQAKQYKAILKALGEEIGDNYWINNYSGLQDKLIFRNNRWIVIGYEAHNRTEVTIKELIKMLVNEETELPKYLPNEAPNPVSRSYCQQPKEKPINISFDGLSGEIGTTLNPEIYYRATITVNIRLDKNAVEKYVQKKLTIKDLNDLIECRK